MAADDVYGDVKDDESKRMVLLSRDTVDQMREKHANNMFLGLGIGCIL